MARLFEEKLGIPYTDRPEDLTLAARRKLRAKFIEADLGITGANFVVADTGTVVLLENEGNIRMSTTLPKVHVAITGIEKVVADFDDLVSPAENPAGFDHEPETAHLHLAPDRAGQNRRPGP